MQTLLSPTQLFSRVKNQIPYLSKGRKSGEKIGKSRRGKLDRVDRLLNEAEEGGCMGVWKEKGRLGIVSFFDCPGSGRIDMRIIWRAG